MSLLQQNSQDDAARGEELTKGSSNALLASVIAARRKKYVMMNAPADALQRIKNVIPGMQSPTVMPLADPAMIAVHAVVDADAVWALLGPLKAVGATSILVMPIEKLIP